MQSLVDGQPANALASLKDRGLAYGDGLFETLAVKAGTPLLLELHMQRLALGCSRLAIVADQALIRSELLAYAQAMGEGVLKLILTRGDSQRGYGISPGAMPRRILQASPAAAWPVAAFSRSTADMCSGPTPGSAASGSSRPNGPGRN